MSKRSIEEAFTSEINEKVVSIVAKETGFEGIESHALESFSNLLGSYIEKMFTSAHKFAELGNRAKPNIHDMTKSLEKAGLQINTFEEYLNNKVNDSKTWRETKKYLKASKSNKSTLEITPEFLPSDHEDSDEEEEDDHMVGGVPTYVPRHLPPFPSKHSFRQTPIYITRPDDPQKVRELNSEQSRTVEENLKKLMSAENQLLRQANVDSANALLSSSTTTIMMPVVNYESFRQRRKIQKQSGATLNVEGSDVPKSGGKSAEEEVDAMMAAAGSLEEGVQEGAEQQASSSTSSSAPITAN